MANPAPQRPPLVRGQTMPLYQRRGADESNRHELSMTAAMNGLSIGGGDNKAASGPRQAPPAGDSSVRRVIPAASQAPSSSVPPSPLTPSDPSLRYPTPPHTNSPERTSASLAPMPPVSTTASSVSVTSRPSTAPTFAPMISRTTKPTSSLRSPGAQLNVNMEIESSKGQHVLIAPLGTGFHPDCITIAARKGSVLSIVADRWELEKDCHYEWQVQFDRDADMSKIQANFDRGVLRVTVPRLGYGERPASLPSPP